MSEFGAFSYVEIRIQRATGQFSLATDGGSACGLLTAEEIEAIAARLSCEFDGDEVTLRSNDERPAGGKLPRAAWEALVWSIASDLTEKASSKSVAGAPKF